MNVSPTFTDDQCSIQRLAKDFADGEVLPVAKAIEGDKAHLLAIWKKLADTGLTGLQFPEAYGGAGVDDISYLLAVKEIAKASASLAVTLSVHTTVGILPIIENGTVAQKDKYLPDLIAGKTIAAFALTEPDAGSDAASGTSKAELLSDGKHYCLNGSKIFTTNAHIADVFVATARTEPDSVRHNAHSAFILDKDMPGMSILPGDGKLGIQGSDWGNLSFDDVHVPTENRLGEAGQGFKIFMNCLNAGRVSIGAISLGIAEACFEAATKYAKQRKQFGQAISNFQAIQFKLADMATELAAAEHLVFHAARLKMAGVPYTQEASMAKLYASETAWKIANEAMQIHGGYGYTKDFPIERYWRDARAMTIVEGTSEIQHLVIARHLV